MSKTKVFLDFVINVNINTALSNSYWRSDCNLMVLFLIRSNENLPYIILLDNFVVFTFDSTIPFDSLNNNAFITAS